MWLKLDDSEGEIIDFTMFAATTGETFGGATKSAQAYLPSIMMG